MRNKPLFISTTVFIVKTINGEKYVLLGRKKAGLYGDNRWNGFGGIKESNEGIIECALRELEEESSISLKRSDLEFRGKLSYRETESDWEVYVFVAEDPIITEPRESREMVPAWFKLSELPLSEMWENDKYWIEDILEGKQLIGTIQNDAAGKVLDYDITVTKNLKL